MELICYVRLYRWSQTQFWTRPASLKTILLDLMLSTRMFSLRNLLLICILLDKAPFLKHRTSKTFLKALSLKYRVACAGHYITATGARVCALRPTLRRVAAHSEPSSCSRRSACWSARTTCSSSSSVTSSSTPSQSVRPPNSSLLFR